MFLQRICPLKPVPWWLGNPEKLRALSTTNINLWRGSQVAFLPLQGNVSPTLMGVSTFLRNWG